MSGGAPISGSCTGPVDNVQYEPACDGILKAATMATAYINSIRESTHPLSLYQIVAGNKKEDDGVSYDLLLLMSESTPNVRAYRVTVMRSSGHRKYIVTYQERVEAPTGKSAAHAFRSASSVVGGRPIIAAPASSSSQGFSMPKIENTDELEQFAQDPQNLPVVGVVAGLVLFILFCICRRCFCSKRGAKSTPLNESYKQVRMDGDPYADDSDEEEDPFEGEDAINPFEN